MTDGVDPGMDAMEPPRPQANFDSPPSQLDNTLKLTPCHDPVLRVGKRRDLIIESTRLL